MLLTYFLCLKKGKSPVKWTNGIIPRLSSRNLTNTIFDGAIKRYVVGPGSYSDLFEIDFYWLLVFCAFSRPHTNTYLIYGLLVWRSGYRIQRRVYKTIWGFIIFQITWVMKYLHWILTPDKNVIMHLLILKFVFSTPLRLFNTFLILKLFLNIRQMGDWSVTGIMVWSLLRCVYIRIVRIIALKFKYYNL